MEANDIELDDLDRHIISRLIADARLAFSDLAKECSVSPATIHLRFERMQRLGVIRGAHLDVDRTKIGYSLCAFVAIAVQSRHHDAVTKQLIALSEVAELHLLTGNFDIMARVFVSSVHHLHLFLTLLQEIDGIESTQTFIALHTPLEREVTVKSPNAENDNQPLAPPPSGFKSGRLRGKGAKSAGRGKGK